MVLIDQLQSLKSEWGLLASKDGNYRKMETVLTQHALVTCLHGSRVVCWVCLYCNWTCNWITVYSKQLLAIVLSIMNVASFPGSPLAPRGEPGNEAITNVREIVNVPTQHALVTCLHGSRVVCLYCNWTCNWITVHSKQLLAHCFKHYEIQQLFRGETTVTNYNCAWKQ